MKSLVRRALQDENFKWVDDLETARLKLETIHAGEFHAIEDPTRRATRLRSQIGGNSFEWSVPDSLSGAQILAVVGQALAWIERCETVEEARLLLRTRKNTRPDLSGYRL